MKKVKQAIVDDYPIVRLGLCGQMKRIGFEVVICAVNADDFTGQLREGFQPEVCLVKIGTERIAEFRTAVDIKAVCPSTKVIAYTLLETRHRNVTAYGIDHFLDKETSNEQLKQVILDLADS